MISDGSYFLEIDTVENRDLEKEKGKETGIETEEDEEAEVVNVMDAIRICYSTLTVFCVLV